MDSDKLNILIIGVGGNVSQGILKALAVSDLKCDVIGACISPDSMGLYTCLRSYICPLAYDKDFLNWLIDICLKEKINGILSGVEEVVEILSLNSVYIYEKTKSIVISSSYEQIKIGNDKLLTCEWLKKNNCNYPEFAASEDLEKIWNLSKDCGYPLIAKPRKGKGSGGIIIINNEHQLEGIKQLKNYVVEEYIGDINSEYTIGCLCDKNGSFIDLIIMKRELNSGTTYKAEVVNDDLIKDEAFKICNSFKPKGPLNIQLRMHKGKPVCFEMNVRFSGTTPMRARLGFNDVEASIRNFIFNEDIADFSNKKTGIVLRYWNELYVDAEAYKSLSKNGELNNLDKINFIENFGISER